MAFHQFEVEFRQKVVSKKMVLVKQNRFFEYWTSCNENDHSCAISQYVNSKDYVLLFYKLQVINSLFFNRNWIHEHYCSLEDANWYSKCIVWWKSICLHIVYWVILMEIGPDDHNSPMQKSSCQTCKTIQIEMKRSRAWIQIDR
jgi:hypothetical protein